MASTVTDRLKGFDLGSAIKAPCLVASTAALTLSSTQVIDGVHATTGQRVLVKDQSGSTANGIYEVRSGAWGRTSDCDGERDLVRGSMVYVISGTTHGNQIWVLSSTGVNVPDSSALTFSLAFSTQ